jgi:hypothetical protein
VWSTNFKTFYPQSLSNPHLTFPNLYRMLYYVSVFSNRSSFNHSVFVDLVANSNIVANTEALFQFSSEKQENILKYLSFILKTHTHTHTAYLTASPHQEMAALTDDNSPKLHENMYDG